MGNCQYDKEELIKITFVLSKYKTDRSKEIDTCSKTCGKVVSSFDIQYASDTVNILIKSVVHNRQCKVRRIRRVKWNYFSETFREEYTTKKDVFLCSVGWSMCIHTTYSFLSSKMVIPTILNEKFARMDGWKFVLILKRLNRIECNLSLSQVENSCIIIFYFIIFLPYVHKDYLCVNVFGNYRVSRYTERRNQTILSQRKSKA